MTVEHSTLTDQQKYEMMLSRIDSTIKRQAFNPWHRDVLALMVKGHALAGFQQAVRWAERREAARLLVTADYSPSAIAVMSGLTRGAVLSLLHRR